MHRSARLLSRPPPTPLPLGSSWGKNPLQHTLPKVAEAGKAAARVAPAPNPIAEVPLATSWGRKSSEGAGAEVGAGAVEGKGTRVSTALPSSSPPHRAGGQQLAWPIYEGWEARGKGKEREKEKEKDLESGVGGESRARSAVPESGLFGGTAGGGSIPPRASAKGKAVSWGLPSKKAAWPVGSQIRLTHEAQPVPLGERKRSVTGVIGRARGFATTAAAAAATERRSERGGRFKGEMVLVTGASRGIGEAVVRRFVEEGASAVLVGRNKGLLEGVRRSLEGAEGEHRVVVGDVRERAFWEGLGKEKLPITHLINSAGISHSSPFLTTTPDLLHSVIETNLLGTMWACRYIGKTMLRLPSAGDCQSKGSIVNVSSLLGVKGGRGSAAYAASKAGVIGLTRALAAELSPSGIRVNVIVPGYVETDMTAAMPTPSHTTALNAIPLARFGTPAEIADAAVFLAGNRYANNCVLNLDGGLSAV